jgi:hypothetical protein
VPKLRQGLLERIWRKLLARMVTVGVVVPGRGVDGYDSSKSDPNSAVELPPKVLSVPRMFPPPSCQVHSLVPPLVLKKG